MLLQHFHGARNHARYHMLPRGTTEPQCFRCSEEPCPDPISRVAQGTPRFHLRRLYGDESELHFWTVAAHYLHSLSRGKESTGTTQGAAPQDRASNPLDICYDILCENAYFQVSECMCYILESCRLGYLCVCKSGQLGKLWN